MIQVHFFGKLGELAIQELGESSIELGIASENDSISLLNVINQLSEKSQKLRKELNNPTNLCAVNQKITQWPSQDGLKINKGDEVAFMSPLSGG